MATYSVLYLIIFQFAVGVMSQDKIIPLGSTFSTTSIPSKWASPSGRYAFGFYPLGPRKLYLLGIWFNNMANNPTLVWTANRDDPVDEGSSVELSHSGQLNLFDSTGRRRWSASNVVGTVSGASMRHDGNFVLWNASSQPAWQSFDIPTDTILPGQTLRWNTSLISKASHNYSSGAFLLRLQEDSNMVLYPLQRRNDPDGAYWSSDTYNPTGQLNLNFEKNGELSLKNRTNNSTIKILHKGKDSAGPQFPARRMTFDSDGIFRIYVLQDQTGPWEVEWSAMEDPCAVKSACGLNGYCSLNVTNEKSCSCPPGFDPIDAQEPLQGCVRNASAGCAPEINQTSQMQKLVNINWAGGNYSVLAPIGEDACEEACRKDCLCVVAIYHNGDHCYLKGGPLLDGRVGPITTSTFVKVSSKAQFTGRASPWPVQRQRKGILVAGISLLAGSAVFLSAASVFLWYFSATRRRGAAAGERDRGNVPGGIQAFTYEDIHSATGGFTEELGKGAFGTVYKGALSQGRPIAVKRLNKVVQDGEREFRTEVAIIGTTHHKNLVQLLGFCDDATHRLLVYEYMGKGSLDRILFDKSIGFLGWNRRVQIAIGIARGVNYLHEECRTQIIHCDIKPQNILLDDGYNPKISDFGLSKLMGIDQTHTFTTARGTRGYLAPEWCKSHMPVTVKVDVYSFGVVLLEIICCRTNIDLGAPENEIVLVAWVYDCLRLGRLMKLVEDGQSELDDTVDGKQLERMVLTGLWCIQDDPFLRPSMKKVVQMLDGTGDIKVPPPPSFFKTDATSITAVEASQQ